jgi:hypothetical protein
VSIQYPVTEGGETIGGMGGIGGRPIGPVPVVIPLVDPVVVPVEPEPPVEPVVPEPPVGTVTAGSGARSSQLLL